ncbi:MAG: MarR family transcriptional regulator [Paludibacteraceae bacterium]|nr:MarR family transcriptional regulator [Paludibacteraceae bacterium]MBO7636221.1 MarR family transcriptional regulator [Paludibacteraceae bacterium]MBR5972746.1 MarR family transcriptional regulator [Paludibacteraceae bacterium]
MKEKWKEDVWMDEIELAFAIISGKVSNAINRVMIRQFRNDEIDMTPEQWLVMACLWYNVVGDHPTQNMIAQATFKDRPSITRLLRNLERQELIVRSEKEGDKRANYVMLTEKGKALHEKVKAVSVKALESVFYGFSEDEVKTAISLLGRVFANLQ